MLTVREIMSTRVMTLDMDDRLELARDLLDQVEFHHLLVTDKRRVVGVLSERDLFKAISPSLGKAAETQKDRNTLNLRVHQVMSRQPVTVTPDSDIKTATALLLEYSIGCLPVTADKQLIGILTWKDLLAAFIHQPHQ
ncbi:CBS domain-containing protein [Shewanella submarina]|uniref:CBS domain-containing protein n=1 Tax=Shewanella submarina TaxID=2016376 RepID=A0ABV7G7C7_9GAMM|nr:CBS domain-containing protein [Shewanella submarina]MCL1037190.1 CBS domain-containing protein [Shewanella submarina]